jgi:hypothetical protein
LYIFQLAAITFLRGMESFLEIRQLQMTRMVEPTKESSIDPSLRSG